MQVQNPPNLAFFFPRVLNKKDLPQNCAHSTPCDFLFYIHCVTWLTRISTLFTTLHLMVLSQGYRRKKPAMADLCKLSNFGLWQIFCWRYRSDRLSTLQQDSFCNKQRVSFIKGKRWRPNINCIMQRLPSGSWRPVSPYIVQLKRAA